MAVAHVADADAAWTTGNLSVSFDVGTDDDRIILLGLGNRKSWGQAVTNVTYAGVSLTQLTSLGDNDASNQSSLDVWYLLNPTSGSNTLAATTDGTNWKATYVAASGGDQTTFKRDDEGAVGNGHGYTISIDSAADDFMYAWWMGADSSGWSHSTAGTEMFDSGGFSSVRQDTSGNPGTEQGGHGNNRSCHYGISLWVPQATTLTPTVAIADTSTLVGTIDDGNILLGNITPVSESASLSIGAVLIKKPIVGDMVLNS